MLGKRNPAIRQALWQMSALLTLACVVAAAVNYWRPDGIPLVGDWSAEARFSDADGKNLAIDLDQAIQLFKKGGAIFVDARPENLYAEGHIRGALNIPWQEADRYFADAADRLDAGKPIITYCDGENCELSHQLALFLQQLGFKNVRLLVNGWTVWQEAALPTERKQ